MSETKLHYYCFSYIGVSISDCQQCYASTYTGYPEKLITVPIIEENKDYAGVLSSATLLSVSYLGHMTKDTLIGGE